ncbi:hypothetical protein PV11_08351 [Exophiala sideris]|uniref:Uncharacterized protein n=1 Tax=Exophiala sideris TaxID=1016849 RepID=A0A0D1YIP1_9EURO|nr:hypothetical protein PV11_08351 [Exophiala sideris]
MPLPPYENHGPVDCTVEPDTRTLKGKSVLVTGGANGFGEAHLRAFAAVGAFVTFGDVDEKMGRSLAEELGSNVQFVKCDATVWGDQLNMFKRAMAEFPGKSCDIVVANAGITGPDEIFALEDVAAEPTKPTLPILQVNLVGAIYTFKLGQHYMRAKPEGADRDRCFIFKGSVAGLLDQPGSFQYSASKFGLRGLMRSARRTSWQEGIRVNYIGPWYTKTTILKPQVVERLVSKGVEFAEVEDCTTAVLRIACDKSINGRSFAILPRSVTPTGYRDAELDDLESEPWKSLQDAVLAAAIRTMSAAVQTAK